jgi:ABC-type uncharacterized transport system YnjBCD ATPase subunit
MALPTPEGKQKEVLCLPELGHFVVLGTAGSGKTTLAIHRSAYIAKGIQFDINHKINEDKYYFYQALKKAKTVVFEDVGLMHTLKSCK